MLVDARIQAFLDYFNQLSNSNLSSTQAIYHKEVQFIDPVHQIQGRDQLISYLEHGYQRLNYAKFTAEQAAVTGNQGFLSWQMCLSHPAIGKGKEITVHGCSALRWQDEQIIYHRDYYDLTEMVYQHIPVVSWLTGKVRQKMADK